MNTCKLIIENAIVDLVKSRWAASKTVRKVQKILPRLNKRCAAALLKLQRSKLSIVIGVITGHCIIGTHARRIGFGHFANDFCGS